MGPLKETLDSGDSEGSVSGGSKRSTWVHMTLAKCLTCLDHLAKCVKVTYKHLVSGVKST